MEPEQGLTAAEWRTWRLFRGVAAQLSTEIDGRLRRDQELAPGEYGTLAAIFESSNRRLRTGDLAAQLGWERSRVSHLIARMEQRGLIRRDPHDDDRRGTEVALTTEGTRRLLRAVRGHAADLQELVFERITPEERTALESILERLLMRPLGSED